MEAGLRRRSCRFARHSPKGTQGRGARRGHARERKRAMEAGLREAAFAASQGTVRRGRMGERVRGAGMHGEGKRAMEAGLRRPLLLPRKAQSEGAVQGRTGARRVAC